MGFKEFLNKLKCKRCANGVFKDNLCKRCYTQNALNAKCYYEHAEEMKKQINNGFKKLEPYLGRYELLEKDMQELYKIAYETPSIITMNPKDMNAYHEMILNDIRQLIYDRKKVAKLKQEYYGDKKVIKEWGKINEELIEMQVKFPQYIEVLELAPEEFAFLSEKEKMKENINDSNILIVNEKTGEVLNK